MLEGGIQSDKWDNLPVLEATVRQCLSAEPLSLGLQYTDDTLMTGATYRIYGQVV